MANQVRFIRRNGRVIPIKNKESNLKYLAGAAVAVGAAVALHVAAPKLAIHAEATGIKFGKQAGRLFGKAGPYGYFNRQAHNFAKAAKSFQGSKAPNAAMTAAKFQFRGAHNAARVAQAEKLASKAGKVSERYYGLSRILKKV